MFYGRATIRITYIVLYFFPVSGNGPPARGSAGQRPWSYAQPLPPLLFSVVSPCGRQRVLLWQQPVHVTDTLSGKWRDAWIGPMGSVLAKRGNACGRRYGMHRAMLEVRCLGAGTSPHRRRPRSRHHGCSERARAPCRGAWPRMGDSLDAGRPCRGTPRCRHGQRKVHGMGAAEDRYRQFMAARAQPPPLTSGDTLQWDGGDAIAPDVALTQGSEPGACAVLPVHGQLATGCQALPCVPRRPLGLLLSRPVPAD
jgi:hypothetical protein